MTTREEALAYGLSFDNVYEEKPFHDPNWQLVREQGTLEHDHSGRNDPRKGDPPDDRRKL